MAHNEHESPLLIEDEIEEQDYTTVPTIEGESKQEQNEEPPEIEQEAEENFFADIPEEQAPEGDFNPMAGNTMGFAIMGVNMYSQYMPKILGSLFKLNPSRLLGLPQDTIRAVHELNKRIEDGFGFTDDDKAQIQASLDAYLQTVNFTEPSPLVTLIIVSVAPVAVGAFNALSIRSEIDKIINEAQQKQHYAKNEDTREEPQAQAA